MDVSNQNKGEVLEKKMNSRERAALEAKQAQKKTRVKYAVVAVIVVLFAAAVIFVNSSAFTNSTALKVNDKNYSVAECNYAYQQNYITFYNNYGSLMNYIMDTSAPLDEQECTLDPEVGTWHDYFLNGAEETLKQTTAFYDAAMQAGYTLTDEAAAEIDAAMSIYETNAANYGYTLDGFLAANYGAGNNAKTVRANMERSAIVEAYLSDLYTSFTYTDDEVNAYLDENYRELNTVSYEYLFLNGAEGDEALQQAKDKAAAVAERMAEEPDAVFADVVAEITEESISSTSYTVSTFLDMFEGSVEEKDIAPGFVFTHETESGCYVARITGLEDNNYKTVSVRHILVNAEDTDGDGTISDAELAAARTAVEEIEKEWKSGAATEESFAELANEKSADPGSNTNGGLYEGIYKGQMIPNFNDFCFAAHKPGDTGIVEGNDGYHLIYFVGEGELYSHQLAISQMQSNDYNAATEAMLDGYTAVRTGMWRYVMKK